uniref:Uncharacterized protein n=1 Tax=Candidatus Methanogaster sp. ANME-2c ERB4 TaxID=2759911 RepID=A0A7G9YF78_9EURY|nr:hypothetical protein LDPDHNFI_00016 [Methanosarcinales archaeon ANME-2c ERB4]
MSFGGWGFEDLRRFMDEGAVVVDVGDVWWG